MLCQGEGQHDFVSSSPGLEAGEDEFNTLKVR